MEEQFTPKAEPTEETKTSAAPSLAVDLRREEYIAFSLLQARVCGPLRRQTLSLVLSLVLSVLVAGMAVMDWVAYKKADPVLWLSVGIKLLPALASYVFFPLWIRKKAEKTYDRRAGAIGESYYGLLTVYPDRVEKATRLSTAKIPFNAHTLFVERADMLVFINRYSPSIVLPARCMTGDMAAALRQAADRLPQRNRVFLSRLCPQGQPVVAPAAVPEPDPVLWEQVVQYTPEETFRAARPMVVKRFWKMAPLLAVVSLLGGYLLGWDGVNLLPFILYFLMCLAALTLFNLVLPLNRMRQIARMQDPKDQILRFYFTRLAFYYETPDHTVAPLLWSEITHVYDKDGMVEIEYDGGGVLCIPKRCVENLEDFGKKVTACRQNSKQ